MQRGEAPGSSDPEHAGRIFENAVHIIGGQSVARRISSPLTSVRCLFVRPGTEAIRGSKPGSAIARLQDRIDGIRRETTGGGVGNETSVFEPADTTIDGRGPNRAARTLIDGVNAVLSQSVGLGVGLGSQGPILVLKAGQPAVLSAQPDLAFLAGNGIDHVLIQPGFANGLGTAIFQLIKATGAGSEPDSVFGIRVDGSIALRGKTSHWRVGDNALSRIRS